MKKNLLKAMVLLTAGFGVAFANPNQGIGKAVDIESYSHQERIKILQEADTCIHNAKTKEEYKACEKKEKQEREQLRQKIFEMRKQELLEKLNNHPNIPQKIKDCVANATNHEQLKACHEQLKEFRLEMKENKMKENGRMK
jgi:ABC-type glutathione transport system ATPase component